jgi:hypothetical protein
MSGIPGGLEQEGRICGRLRPSCEEWGEFRHEVEKGRGAWWVRVGADPSAASLSQGAYQILTPREHNWVTSRSNHSNKWRPRFRSPPHSFRPAPNSRLQLIGRVQVSVSARMRILLG